MERKMVNPWTWQDQFGFAHATEITGGERILYCAGQLSSDENGEAVHAGDMAAQIGQAFDNLPPPAVAASQPTGMLSQPSYPPAVSVSQSVHRYLPGRPGRGP